MKRIIAVAICIVMLLSLLAAMSCAEYDYDSFYIGAYLQDDPDDEIYNQYKAGIEWLILDVVDNKALLVSANALDVRPYSEKTSTWKDSAIRRWLNHDFYDCAFTDEEKEVILTTTVDNSASQNNPEWDVKGSSSTEDKIFLLSAAEYLRYFGKGDKCLYSDYALSKTMKIFSETGSWWLRSPGKKTGEFCTANKGKVSSSSAKKDSGICPAMWIDLSVDTSDFRFEKILDAYDLYDKGDFLEAAQIFHDLGFYNYGYLWSADALYQNAVSVKNNGGDLQEVIRLTEDFFGYCSEYDVPIETVDYEIWPYDFLNEVYYDLAVDYQEAKDYSSAVELFKMLGNYKDSLSRMLDCFDATGIHYAYFDVTPVNAGSKGGYSKEDRLTVKDPHNGWRLGRFIISGFTEETSDGVFLKTLGDDVTLWFELDQDIDALNGNEKLTIVSDKNAQDVPFNYSEKGASFGRGALLIQHEDFRHNKTPISPYVDYLAANETGIANTRVEIHEEGTYTVALDYLVKSGGIPGSTDGYRISFSFQVKNGDGVAFLRDVGTTSELQDYSLTSNGFKIDLAKSHSVKVHVTRYDINLNGTALDVRQDAPASDGDSFTKTGYYEIEMTNAETGKTIVKHIFVGESEDLSEFRSVNTDLQLFGK